MGHVEVKLGIDANAWPSFFSLVVLLLDKGPVVLTIE